MSSTMEFDIIGFSTQILHYYFDKFKLGGGGGGGGGGGE